MMDVPYIVEFRRFDGGIERVQRWGAPMSKAEALAYFSAIVPFEDVWDGVNQRTRPYGFTPSASDVRDVEGAFSVAGAQASIAQLGGQEGFEVLISDLQTQANALSIFERPDYKPVVTEVVSDGLNDPSRWAMLGAGAEGEQGSVLPVAAALLGLLALL